jgi:DNA-binding XRE family transcriptional regulator
MRDPLSYVPEAILTQEEVAQWLGVSTRTVRKLRIRRWASSRRLVRYLAKHVLEYLEDQAR